MKYNFDEPVDRSQNRSAKYDERVKNFGTDDVIPLWIADMDFKTAQPIIDACKKKAEEGIWGYTSRPDSYFKAYADWQERRNGWKFDPSLCSWSLGVVPALAGIIKLFTQKGEKVLIQPPTIPWDGYGRRKNWKGCLRSALKTTCWWFPTRSIPT